MRMRVGTGACRDLATYLAQASLLGVSDLETQSLRPPSARPREAVPFFKPEVRAL